MSYYIYGSYLVSVVLIALSIYGFVYQNKHKDDTDSDIKKKAKDWGFAAVPLILFGVGLLVGTYLTHIGTPNPTLNLPEPAYYFF